MLNVPVRRARSLFWGVMSTIVALIGFVKRRPRGLDVGVRGGGCQVEVLVDILLRE